MRSIRKKTVIVNLLDLPLGAFAVVRGIRPVSEQDTIARRLGELGFVAGETVRLVVQGPFGADPLLVELGGTRFALRRAEAARIELESGA